MNPHEGPDAFDDIALDYLNQAAWRASETIDRYFDLRFNPWRYPDRNPFPALDAFPRAARITRRARARYNAARYRLAEIVEVARHGLPPEGDDWC